MINAQRLAMEKRIGNLAVRALQDIANSLPGHSHLQGNVSLVVAFQVGESERFQFISGQGDLFQIAERDTTRLKVIRDGTAPDATLLEWTDHAVKLLAKANYA